MAALPRPGLFVAAIAAGLLAAQGCGTGAKPAPGGAASAPPTPAALRQVVAAAAVTLRQTAAVSIRLAGSQVSGSSAQTVPGTGVFDLGASRGTVQLHQLTGLERMVFLPASVFVSQTGGAGILPKGKVWISAGLTEQSLATNFPQFVTQAESLNPSLLLSEVKWGATSASGPRPTGSQSGYTVTVDLAKAQQSVSRPSALAFSRAIGYEIAEQSGGASPTLSVQILVDGHGRVGLIRASPPGAGLGTVTLSLSGWGAVPGVTPPPRSEVVDISSLAPGGERENAAGGDSDGA